MKLKTKIALVSIVTLGAFLRFTKLTSIPISLYSDEVAIGYNAYSILKTGRDEFGEFLPLSFRALNDFKPPLVTYLVAISQSVFGISDWAVRFPAALFGTLSVFLIYFLVKQLRFSPRLALLASLFVALNPWQLMFSRATLAMGFALTLIIGATLFFLLGLKKPTLMIVSAILFALSLYTYHSARIFSPLFVLILAATYRKNLLAHKRQIITASLIGTAITLPLILKIFSPEILVRPLGISIFSNPPTPNPYELQLSRLVSLRAILPNPLKILASIIHNRRLVSFYLVINGYLKHFSPNFLFTSHPHPQFQIQGTGLFYLWEIITLPVGIFALLRRKSKSKTILSSWLLLAPLASAFTFSTPAVGRAIFMSAPLSIFSAIGALEVFKRLYRHYRVLVAPTLTVVVLLVGGFLYHYFTFYPQQTSSSWGWEYQQVATYLEENADQYEKIVFIPKVGSGFSEPHIYMLYHTRYDPATYLSEGGSQVCRFGHSGRYNFGEYEFRTIDCAQDEVFYDPLDNLPENSLVITLENQFKDLTIDPIHTIHGSEPRSALAIYLSNDIISWTSTL